MSLPKFGGGGGGAGGMSVPGDPYVLSAIGAGILSLGVMAWLFMSIRSDREEWQVRLEAALQDSVRFADLIQRTATLNARRDSIAQRIGIIQEIDAGRYVWPHIFDELGAALPDYTWVREITQVQADPLQIRLAGRAGTPFAITGFMRGIEASPFLRGVQLERTEQVPSEEDPDETVYVFELMVTYESPPIDELESVPLLGGEPMDESLPVSGGG